DEWDSKEQITIDVDYFKRVFAVEAPSEVICATPMYEPICGTPRYMAPQMLDFVSTDIRPATGVIRPATDVYQLGVMLYELLTGSVPWTGSSLDEVFRSILEHQVPRPRDVVPNVPPEIDLICMTAMARDWRQRYHSAVALAEDLQKTI